MTITSIAGIGQVASVITADVFPNPTTGQLNVKLQLPDNDHRVTITIRNVLGQIIQSADLDPAKDILTSFDLSNFSPGIYFISIHNGDNDLVKKVMVEEK